MLPTSHYLRLTSFSNNQQRKHIHGTQVTSAPDCKGSDFYTYYLPQSRITNNNNTRAAAGLFGASLRYGVPLRCTPSPYHPCRKPLI
ncbi:MAG: hypothetical protein ACK57K_08685, partial [Chryseotalea sp.]